MIDLICIRCRRLRIGSRSIPRKILIQLCTALFCLYLVFLVGIDQVSNLIGCASVATLLHFLTLASIMWMGVEAHHMYQLFVKVFGHSEHFVMRASVVAWGEFYKYHYKYEKDTKNICIYINAIREFHIQILNDYSNIKTYSS